MKIAVRGGHTFSCSGASALIDETTEDRKVKDAVIKYLKKEGHQVLDVTPPDSCNTINSELTYGVTQANNWGADLYLPIHFNKAYDSYNGAIGTEAYIYDNDGVVEVYAKRIIDKLTKNGFKPHGNPIKAVGGDLYDLRESNMRAILIEVCFVEATEDVTTYRRLGADNVGRLIVEGLLNKEISSSNNITKKTTPIKQHRNVVVYPAGAEKDKICAEFFELIMNGSNEDCICVSDNDYKTGIGKSVYAVGGSLKNKIKADVYLYGKNRYETAYSVLNRINGKK